MANVDWRKKAAALVLRKLADELEKGVDYKSIEVVWPDPDGNVSVVCTVEPSVKMDYIKIDLKPGVLGDPTPEGLVGLPLRNDDPYLDGSTEDYRDDYTGDEK